MQMHLCIRLKAFHKHTYTHRARAQAIAAAYPKELSGVFFAALYVHRWSSAKFRYRVIFLLLLRETQNVATEWAYPLSNWMNARTTRLSTYYKQIHQTRKKHITLFW